MTRRSAALQLVLALSFCHVVLAQTTGTFIPTGSMTTARESHTATQLPNGTVLLAGGQYPSNSAEVYDPASGTFSRTGNMTTFRFRQAATLLPDGTVLMTGGSSSSDPRVALPSAELYIPSILVPIPVAEAVQFDRMVVSAGSSFQSIFSGSNLTPEMFFDVRFTSPESNESAVALNWQRGLSASHDGTCQHRSGQLDDYGCAGT